MERDLDRISRFLSEKSALCFAGRRKAALRCHLDARLDSLGLADLARYEELLRNSPDEQETLYDLITVNETSFFRNPGQFQDLRTRIIPKLEQERGRRLLHSWGRGNQVAPHALRKLRFLSAGCSTGEEPYSLAMTLLDALRYPLAWDLEILAGDLSAACLRLAAEGRYEEARLKGVPQPYRDRYLRREAGGWRLADEAKGMVRFLKLNLARICAGERFPELPEDFTGFDVIFCRNVMIYFPPESQQRLVEVLQQLLAPGGYLFTGDAEPLHLYRHDLETVAGVTSLIYRKKTGRHPSPPAAATAGAGAELLSRCGVRELLLMLSDPSLGFRAQAMQRLVCLGLDAVAPALEAAVRDDGNAGLRNGAMELLVRFGEAALPRVITLLSDPDDEVRNFGTVMLGSIRSRGAVPHLITALRDPAPNVRHGAAEALGRIGDPRALEGLLGLLDQGFWLQFPAVDALGALGDAAALPRLLDLLDDELLFEPVTRALQKIADRAALPRLRAVTCGSDARRARLAAQAIAAIEQGSLTAPDRPAGVQRG